MAGMPLSVFQMAILVRVGYNTVSPVPEYRFQPSLSAMRRRHNPQYLL